MKRGITFEHPQDRLANHSTYVMGCRCLDCKAANTDYSNKYYKKDLEKSRAGRRITTAKYLKANPGIRVANEANRRARQRNVGGTHTDKEWLALCEQYGNTCLYPNCETKTLLTRDHVIPLICGGPNSIENIQPLCRKHNSMKGKQIIDYRLKEVK